MLTTRRTTGRLEKKKRRKSAVVLGVIITIVIITITIVKRRSLEGVGLVVLVTGLFSTNIKPRLKISFIMCIVWNMSRKGIKVDDHIGLILPE